MVCRRGGKGSGKMLFDQERTAGLHVRSWMRAAYREMRENSPFFS